MELGDIWLKVAKNQLLTPQEEEFLRLSGRDTQMNNAFTAGIKNGTSNIDINEISVKKILVGKDQYSGIAARYYYDNLSVPTSTYTDVPSWTAEYADFGFTTSGSSIIIPQKGVYQIVINSWWNANGTGYRDMGTKINGSATSPFDNAAGNGAVLTYLSGIDELDYEAGDAIKITVYQTSGGNLVMGAAWVILRKIR